jgi:ornithine cyclodeaminase/alanine dehydrogenase
VFLYDGTSGVLEAIIEADWLGRIRTGAASGVAAGFMAKANACEVGIFGSGAQARTQLEALCQVRTITEVHVYSPNQEHREAFAREMEQACRVSVVPVHRPEEAAMDMDIVVTATKSREPVLQGNWLSEGTMVIAMGSNALNRAELEVDVIRRTDVVVVDSADQCQLEAGDFVTAIDQGVLHWSRVHELSEVVVGRQTGRPTDESITLFKSVGLAIEDLAVAARVFELAKQRRLGRELPIC